MKWLILVATLCFTISQAAKIDVNLDSNIVELGPEGRQKWFTEWLGTLFGGGTTASPVINDPVAPKECPACQCGITRTRRRIIGGHETIENEYPWVAMLLYNGRPFCGGTVINSYYILTAAHCTSFRKERMKVRLLEHDVNKGKGNDSRIIDRKVVQIIRHQRYNPGTYDNDIALLKIDEGLDFSHAIKKRASRDDESTTEAEVTTVSEEITSAPTTEEDDVKVRPVCLPAPGLSYTRECGVVIGWGVTEQGGFTSSTLQEVKVPIVSNKECRDRSYGRRVTENMICAGEPEGGRDACQGDSGGPLHVFNETSGKYQEIGVVSWGEGCAQPNKYGVYTRVNRYLTWIRSNTADACYCD